MAALHHVTQSVTFYGARVPTAFLASQHPARLATLPVTVHDGVAYGLFYATPCPDGYWLEYRAIRTPWDHGHGPETVSMSASTRGDETSGDLTVSGGPDMPAPT
jgi:hypothetical protein